MPLADGLVTPPRRIINAPLDAAAIADLAMRLLAARARIDRIMWGDVDQRRNDPIAPDDAVARLRLIVSAGVSVDRIPDILLRSLTPAVDHALHPDLLHAMVDAYRRLANITIPAAWHPDTALLAASDPWDDSLRDAWTSLCDLIASIIGHEPRYGLAVLPSA